MEFMLQLLFTMAVLFICARIGSAIVSKFGLPGLIGEIVMGIVIANLSFGDWSLLSVLDISIPGPGEEATSGSDVYTVIKVFAELGVIFLLFSVGLETKVSDLLGSGKAALLAAVLGVLLPFMCGIAIIMALDGNMSHALFMGAAMVATSVGITARIIKDMKLMDTREARIIIAAAVIDDVLGMMVLAVVNGIAGSGEISIVDIILITLQAVAFVVAVILICKYLIPRIYDYRRSKHDRKVNQGKVPYSFNKLVLAIIVCLAMSAFAEFIGLAAIIGAFLAGMLFAEYAWEWDLEHKVESITTFLISFFFLNVGLQVDVFALTDISVLVLTIIIIAAALLTKYVGCGMGAKLGDKDLDKDGMNIIGVGMMPRGEVGIIVASIGLASGAMSMELYAVVVLMSVMTTIIAPPMLSKLFRRKYQEQYRIMPDDRI